MNIIRLKLTVEDSTRGTLLDQSQNAPPSSMVQKLTEPTGSVACTRALIAQGEGGTREISEVSHATVVPQDTVVADIACAVRMDGSLELRGAVGMSRPQASPRWRCLNEMPNGAKHNTILLLLLEWRRNGIRQPPPKQHTNKVKGPLQWSNKKHDAISDWVCGKTEKALNMMSGPVCQATGIKLVYHSLKRAGGTTKDCLVLHQEKGICPLVGLMQENTFELDSCIHFVPKNRRRSR